MNGWKVTAIIFIILAILETAFIIFAYSLGQEMESKDNECQLNICKGYDAYLYDDTEEICYCYQDNNVTYWEYIK